MFDDPMAQQMGIEFVRKRDGGNGGARLLAGGNQFDFEFCAVSPNPTDLMLTLFGVQVSTEVKSGHDARRSRPADLRRDHRALTQLLGFLYSVKPLPRSRVLPAQT